MNIVIFGATGPTGRELVTQALNEGHNVTAFARNPGKISFQHERLRIARGDITNITSVEAAIAGQEVVLSALGVRKLTKNSILSDGTRNIISTMISHNVRRLVCETSLGVGDSKADLGALFRWVFKPLVLRNAFADKEIQEQLIRESGLDWVIVRPAYLTNGLLTGNYVVWTGRKAPGVTDRISRADVAHFMFKQLVTDTYLRKSPGISY